MSEGGSGAFNAVSCMLGPRSFDDFSLIIGLDAGLDAFDVSGRDGGTAFDAISGARAGAFDVIVRLGGRAGASGGGSHFGARAA